MKRRVFLRTVAMAAGASTTPTRLGAAGSPAGAARSFQPLTAAQWAAFRARTAEAAVTGRYERVKTSARFDATAHHPEWLG
jgi:hypothetical protein